MGEFPEKIWAIEKGYPSRDRVSCSVLEHGPDEATEYVRADLYTALEARLAERVKIGPLAHVIAEMLDRAGEPRPNRDVLHDILAQALPAALEATRRALKVNRPTHCGGCGETDPAKRCIGCLADFGPASHQQQETADADHCQD